MTAKLLLVVALFVPMTVFGQSAETIEVPVEDEIETTVLEEATALERAEDLLFTLNETEIAEDGIAGFILRWRVFQNANDLYEALEKYEALSTEQSGLFWEFRVAALERRAESQLGLFVDKVALLFEYDLITEEDAELLLGKALALLELLEA